ncbi:MAG: anaerobic ribonucleoside-triphosphate reductase activating protein [Patescibacteria group bacterium]
MIIGGFQKISLIDYPGKIASIIFTKGCLFRCPYCHNPELVEYKDSTGIDEKYVFEHLEKRRDFIEGVCVTGGEPTLHKDLPDFIARVKSLGYSVKLDTNGVTPSMVAELLEKKLVDYIAMDIKNTWDKYGLIAKIAPGKEKFLDRCRETFSIIQNSGIPHEWRTTVLPGVHNENDFLEMASYFNDGEKYFLQDISYKKNLDQSLDRTKKIDVKNIASLLRERFPEIAVETR